MTQQRCDNEFYALFNVYSVFIQANTSIQYILSNVHFAFHNPNVQLIFIPGAGFGYREGRRAPQGPMKKPRLDSPPPRGSARKQARLVHSFRLKPGEDLWRGIAAYVARYLFGRTLS